MSKIHTPKSRPKPEAPRQCSGCFHVWQPEPVVREDTFFCRRYPPHLQVNGTTSAFAPVKPDWVCGEWTDGVPQFAEGQLPETVNKAHRKALLAARKWEHKCKAS